jgi:hypothetical protein
MVLVDPSDASRRFFNLGSSGETALDKLPHVLAAVTNARELDEVVKRLQAEYDEEVIARLSTKPDVFAAQNNTERSIFVIIDHYDDVEVLNKGKLGLTALSEVGKGKNLHFVIGGSLGIMRSSSDDLRRRAESARYTLVLQDYEAVRYMGARGNFTVTQELPPGRGFLVKAVTASLVQMAMPYVDGLETQTPQEQLDGLIVPLQQQYAPARWSYFADDLTALDDAIRGELPEDDTAEAGGAATGEDPSTSDAMAEIARLMEMQASLSEMMGAEIPDASNFASVEIEVPDEPGADASANGSEAG